MTAAGGVQDRAARGMAGALATRPLRKHRVQTRIRRAAEAPMRAWTRWRLGCQVRDVLLFAWLTL